MRLVEHVAAELPGLRAEAEALMVDACTIGVESRSDVLEEETGEYELIVAEPVYSGKCQFKPGGTANREVDVAGQQRVETAAVLKLPVVGSELVTKNMIAIFTSSEHDPALPGVRVRITGPFHSSYATTRRFAVEETR